MQFPLMRMLDRYVGALALLMLRPFIALRSRRQPHDVRCIMVQKYFGVGSIINAIPTIEALRCRWPTAKIVFVTFADLQPAVELFGVANESITIDNRSILTFLRTFIQSLVKLWTLRPDVSIDLEFFSKFSAMMACLSLAQTRVGFFAYYNLRSPLLTHPVSFNHYRHISRAFLAHAEALGIAIEEPLILRLPPPPDRFYTEIAPSLGDYRMLIVVNPNASALCRLRMWPPDKFARTADILAEHYPQATLVFIGSNSEAQYVSSVVAGLEAKTASRAVNLAGRTSLGGLVALLEKADLLITSDSGPAHIAAGFLTPEVVIFGPETPVLYGPLNPHCRALYKPPYCSPCLHVLDNKQHEDCEDVRCIREVTVEDVVGAALDVMGMAHRPSVGSNER